MGAVRDGIGQCLENLRAVQHDIGARGCRARVRIGPAVARAHQPHFGQPEIQHGPRRLPDILAQLRADQDDDGGRLLCISVRPE